MGSGSAPELNSANREYRGLARRILLCQIMANTIGAMACTLYFAFLDQPELTPALDKQLITSLIMTLALVVGGTVYGTRWSREIKIVFQELMAGRPVDREHLTRAQRKSMNAPLQYGLISLAAWGMAAVIMGGYRIILPFPGTSLAESLSQGLGVGFGVLISGLGAGSIVFFYTDYLFRKVRPVFFPSGGLVETKGVYRLSVRRRLLITSLIISVGPILVVGFMFYHKISSSPAADLEGAMTGVLAALTFIPAALLMVNVILSRLAASSIYGPISDLESAMARVREGDLTARVTVGNNDELGALAESFNHMTNGLRERDRMQRSLDLAKEVQQSLLPLEDPLVEGLDISGVSHYCDETGGDYYDYLLPDEPGRVGIIVGDVSDHGVSAALLMTTARAFLRQKSSLSGDLAEVVTDVNRQLCRDVEDSGGFMTLFYALIDVKAGQVEWVRAGHDPALLYNLETGAFRELGGPGVPLGVADDFTYERQEDGIKPGEILTIATDGVWEARNPAGEPFGKARLRNIIKSEAGKTAREIVTSVVEAVARFIYPLKNPDDVTLVVVKTKGQ